MKYKFRSYYKYTFSVIGEDGKVYRLIDDLCNGGDIYRLSIDAEGEAKVIDENTIEIDGSTFQV